MSVSGLKCLSYCALSDEDKFYRLGNAELLRFIQGNFWCGLNAGERAMLEKLLSSERTRQLCKTPLAQLAQDDTQSRYNRYRGMAEELGRRCAERLVASASCSPSRVKLVISTTAVAGLCPPLSSIIINDLKLPATTEAIDLSHMGCSALLWGIELAGRMLKRGEAAIVLGMELTSYMADYHGSPESLMAATVFGDGAAGVLVAHPDTELPAKLVFGSTGGSIVGSEQGLRCIQYIGGTVAPRIVLGPEIEEVASSGIHLALRNVVKKEYVTLWEKLQYLATKQVPDWSKAVDYFVSHTPGTKVLQGVAAALNANGKQFRHNFSAFSHFGNLSSVSLLYSLRLLDEQSNLTGSRLLFLAFGSGFMTRVASATA